MLTLWQEVVAKAFARQHGLCALCGKTLSWSQFDLGGRGAWHAHHVNGTPGDDRVSNCACLCINPNGGCHLDAHDGDWKHGTLLKRQDFDYWNGD